MKGDAPKTAMDTLNLLQKANAIVRPYLLMSCRRKLDAMNDMN